MKSTQNGNALTGALGAVIIIALLIFLLSIALRPYSAIDSTKQSQLNNMVSSTERTEFEKPFKDRIEYYLNDGKINNKEFYSLVELYDGYNTSKLIGKDSEYNNKEINSLKSEKTGDELESYIYRIMGFILVFCLVIGFIIFGWVKMREQVE